MTVTFNGDLADRMERYRGRHYPGMPPRMQLVFTHGQVSASALDWAKWASIADGDADAVDILERLAALTEEQRRHAYDEGWEACEFEDTAAD